MLILQGRMHATFQKYDDSEAVIEEIWERGIWYGLYRGASIH